MTRGGVVDTYTKLLRLMPVIYPQFYVIHDVLKNELILLKLGNAESIEGHVDKTQFEAFCNHFHLFDNIGEENYANVVCIGKSIANNLLAALSQSFPDKEFVVYLEVSMTDSVTVRFHQSWKDEPLYFDMTQEYEGVKIFELKNF